MVLLFKAFWNILILRYGPQNLPASQFLLIWALFLHVAIGVALGLFTLTPASSLVSAMVSTLLMTAIIYSLLSLRRKTSRFTQTMTAMAGCEVMLGLMAYPISYWYFTGLGDPNIPAMLSLVILVWNLMLASHIFHHALDVPRSMGYLFAVGYLFAALMVADMVGVPLDPTVTGTAR